MRTLTNEELQRIYIEQDMLRGNISRMCTTDDMIEFDVMCETALKRLRYIIEICDKRFLESEV